MKHLTTILWEAQEARKFVAPDDALGGLAREAGYLRGAVRALWEENAALRNQRIERQRGCHYVEVFLGDVPITLEVEYEAGDPGVHTFPNGDPGYPPTPASVSLCGAYIAGEYVQDLERTFSAETLNSWIEEAEGSIENSLADEEAYARSEAAEYDKENKL